VAGTRADGKDDVGATLVIALFVARGNRATTRVAPTAGDVGDAAEAID